MERSFPGWRLYRLAALAVAATLPCAAGGMPGGIEGLKAEVSAEQTLFTPGQPLRLRFTLINQTDEVVEVPDVRMGSAAVALPMSLVYGEASKPALSSGQDGARAEPLRPEKPLEADTGDQPLRLGPRATIGTEIDLRPLHRELRYTGIHRVEWKPLGGKIGTAALEFRVEMRKSAILDTDFGKITFVLFYDKAPQNVDNFLELCRKGSYDGSLIHRIFPSFMQGGKPMGGKAERRPDGKTVPGEFNNTPFDLGTLAMALAVVPGTDKFEPNSASCQFIIGLRRMPHWDDTFTVIGQASDDESLRTLRALSERPTDANGQPLQTVRIIHLLLLDVELPRPERLELGGR